MKYTLVFILTVFLGLEVFSTQLSTILRDEAWRGGSSLLDLSFEELEELKQNTVQLRSQALKQIDALSETNKINAKGNTKVLEKELHFSRNTNLHNEVELSEFIDALAFRITQIQLLLDDSAKYYSSSSSSRSEPLESSSAYLSCFNELRKNNEKPSLWFSVSYSSNLQNRFMKGRAYGSMFHSVLQEKAYIITSNGVSSYDFKFKDPNNTRTIEQNQLGAGQVIVVRSPVYKLSVDARNSSEEIYVQAQWINSVDHPNGYSMKIVEGSLSGYASNMETISIDAFSVENERRSIVNYLEKALGFHMRYFKKKPSIHGSYKSCLEIPEIREKLLYEFLEHN